MRPRSWVGTLAVGIVVGAAFKLLMKAIVMPLLDAPRSIRYHWRETQRHYHGCYVIIFAAGFGEETVFRGWMFERLANFSTQRVGQDTDCVDHLFGLAWNTILSRGSRRPAATIVGLVFGTIFSITGRLPMLIIAHAASI